MGVKWSAVLLFLFLIFLSTAAGHSGQGEITKNEEQTVNNNNNNNNNNIGEKISESKEELQEVSGDVKKQFTNNKQLNESSADEQTKEEKYFVEVDGGFALKEVWEHFTNPSNQLEKFTRMIQWIHDEGGYVAPLQFEISNGKVENIKSKGEIGKEERFLKVPFHLFLSTTPPSESDPPDIPYCDLTRRWPYHEISKVFANTTEHYIKPLRSSKVLLSLCLIHEMKKTLDSSFASFYRHYFDTLPLRFDQPITWKERQVERLKGSAVYAALHSARKQLQEDYVLLSQALFTHPSQGFTLANYNWAMLFVTSKMWTLQLPNHDRPVRALIPLLDHIPFSFEGNSKVQYRLAEDDPKFIEFYSNVDLHPQSNIYDVDVSCYTTQCLFLNHGIIIDDNPYDYLPLVIVNAQSQIEYLDTLIHLCGPSYFTDPLIEKKLAVLLQHNLSQVRIANKGSKELYAAFRILTMSAKEIESSELIERALSGLRVSSDNDDFMSSALHSIIRSTLSSYPTSLQYDRLVLSKEKEISRLEKEYIMATKLLVKEKELLSSVLQFLSNHFDI